MSRATPFADIVRHLVPFFVSRQVVAERAASASAPRASTPGYQLSQRADFFEVEVGLETTLKRPIVNTRDEPHATADKYRRLHVIIGDANLAEVVDLLKLGTTSLVLAMVEAGRSPGPHRRAAGRRRCARCRTTRRLAEHRHRCATARRLTAVAAAVGLPGAGSALRRRAGTGADVDADTVEVLDRWESVLTRLERDPMECARELDWVAKLALLQGFRDREGLDWDHPGSG